MEDRGEVLDLAASGAELELAAAVDVDPALLAVVVRVEERADTSEAGRLEVERPGMERQRLDVADRVDDRVPGDPVPMRLEQPVDLAIAQIGVLDPGAGERLRDEAVKPRIGRLVDDRPPVRPLRSSA